MKTIAAFLLNVLVKQFYVINAGFFLFVFFVFFGMVYGGQLIAYHQSLITGMISSPVFMGFVWVAWLLYNLKCILFCTGIIREADSSYIYTLKAVPASMQMPVYLLVATLQYMPVLAYSFFVVYMAANRSMPVTAMLVVTYQLLMVVFAARMLFISINKSNIASIPQKIMAITRSWQGLKLGYHGFLLGNIFYAKKMAFMIVKIFSLLLLSVSFVRNGDHFDEDLFSIFFQLIFVSHAILVFYCVDFSETQLQFSRNLPVALHKVAARYLFSYSILLLPEAAFMLINNHSNLPFTEIILLYGTAVSTLFLYTAILYESRLDMESYMLFVFIVFLMIFFLQKTGLHLLALLAILITAIAVFRANYYSFEKE
jgi:hypothetical protein